MMRAPEPGSTATVGEGATCVGETVLLRAHGHVLRALRIPSAATDDDSGPTLIFLHEGLGSIAQWRDFPARVAARTGLPALVYERLGHGASSPEPAPRTPDYLHREALDVLPEVMAGAGIEQAILVGHSDGGSIALLAASDPAIPVAGIVTEAAHVSVEAEALAGIRDTVEAYERAGLRARLAPYHGAGTDTLFHAWSGIWLSEEFAAWNIEDRLSAVRCPVLAIQGEGDQYGTVAQLDAIVQGVGGPVTRMLVPRCGHSPHHEASDAVLVAVAGFAQGLVD